MAINLMFLMIPLFFTIYLYFKYGAEAAIEKSVIPSMILVPLTFKVIISPYMPTLTFYSCAILPLFVIGIVVYKSKLEYSVMDIMVIAFVIACVNAGYESTGVVFSKVTVMYEATETILPYFVIRTFVSKDRVLRVVTVLTLFISATAFLTPFEFFLNKNLAQVYQIFWKDNGLWFPFVRYGFFRVFSNYWHPIHAGIVFSVALIFSIMLYKMNVFKNKRVIKLIIFANIMAILMTISRASYVVIIPAILIFWYSTVKNKKAYAVIVSCIMIFAYILGTAWYDSYLELAPGEVPDEAKQSAAYRKVLTENYIGIAEEKLLYGYGPKLIVVDGQWSIDNYYLLMVLRYGIIPLILFIAMHLMIIIKAIILSREMSKRKNMILWAMVAIVFYYSILNYFVWQGYQSKIILFMIFALFINFTSRGRIEKEKKWSFKRII